MKVRLNKFIAECGITSRRKAENFILEGRVAVNGVTITQLSYLVDPDKDIVTLDGEKLKAEKKVYFLLNKPKGYITTTSDEKNRKKVTDLIKTNYKIFPVGRLDYDTTGVLILTNDGEFANFLTHPSNQIPREYNVLLNRDLEMKDKEKLLKGITLDKRKSKFEEINFIKKGNFKRISVVTVEGRNRFVKRMFEVLGYRVESLERIRFGPFTIKNLPEGYYRKLSYTEIQEVYKTYGK
ncbi:pseudouridine synthase [Rosettibacter firmus]|uniref:pseudouridine synthase n=1 Tax=Rosettibacter firmus TaxID=3111522 RepID=UPI00336C0B7D